MKTPTRKRLLPANACIGALVICLASAGCGRNAGQPANFPITKGDGIVDPLALVLAPHDGAGRLDAEIRQCQTQLRAGTNAETSLERLGWLFIAKARDSFDPGFYKLGEQCALRLE